MLKERIIKWEKGTGDKKYKVTVKGYGVGKERIIQFGSKDYQQYYDSSPLNLYKNKNHLDKSRRKNYFKRHSGVESKKKALEKEKKNSKGKYTPKILSHTWLW